MEYTYTHLLPLARPNRAYLQAFMVQRNVNIPSASAYADKLASEHYTPDRHTLTLLCVAMTAHLDGYMAGYEEGFDAGCEEGESSVAHKPVEVTEVTS